MEIEKVKEIKKALEAYGNENKGITILRGGEIQSISYADILTLINELESENEKWQRKAINYYEKAKSYGIECIIDTDIDERLKECLGK